MRFLVELDPLKPMSPLTPEAARAFVERIIFPTIARPEQLIADRKIGAGGPVVGPVALQFILEGESHGEADQIVASLRLGVVADLPVPMPPWAMATNAAWGTFPQVRPPP